MFSKDQIDQLLKECPRYLEEMQQVEDEVVQGWTHWWGSLCFALKRIAELKQQLKDMESHADYVDARSDGVVEEMKECYERIAELESEAKQLRAALEKYGQHLDDCPYETILAAEEGQMTSMPDDEDCTCGLEKALD